MAKGKKKSADNAVDALASYTPTPSSTNTEKAPEAVADASVEHIIVPPNMDIVNRALAESGQIPNLVGGGVDIASVVAKHLVAAAEGAPGSSKVPVSRSTVVHPVKLVHCIASEMYEKNPELQRKDVIAACEAAGIATHTARTQYQIWHQAMKSDRAAKAAQELAATTQHRTPLAVQRGTVPNNTSARKPRK